jgi:choline transport protein
MLNGAYSVGTPDCVSHLAEEIPSPSRNSTLKTALVSPLSQKPESSGTTQLLKGESSKEKTLRSTYLLISSQKFCVKLYSTDLSIVPLAIAAQMLIGFLTAFLYMIAIFYTISSMDSVLNAPYFPLATIYSQATSSNAGTMGLLFIIFVPVFCCCVGTYITAGRCLWTIARDGAVPFSGTFGRVSGRWKNPWNATLFCGCFSTVLGAIYVGSSTAFNAFVGSFVVLSTLSYLASILPFMLTGRFSQSKEQNGNANGMRPGWFEMGHWTGYVVNGISCVYIVVFVVIYCFPYSMPVTAANMNYACLITGTITLVAGGWWVVRGKGYVGPKAMIHMGEERGEDFGVEREKF